MKSGQLSWKRPLKPAGYQIKCPMPSEGNSSPTFHAVSPLSVPPDSFCHIFLPMAAFWADVRLLVGLFSGEAGGFPGAQAEKARARRKAGFRMRMMMKIKGLLVKRQGCWGR